MDSLPSPPSKKRRASNNINIPMIECKREFNLPHKFPSTVSSKYNFMLRNDGVVTITNAQVGSNLNELRIGNFVPTNNVRKLRIKTREGRDLGEVKVQFLSRNNVANTPKLQHHTQTMSHKKSNSANLSIAPSIEIDGCTNTLSSKKTSAASQLYVRSVPSKELSAVINNKLQEAEAKAKNGLQKHYILAKINKMDQSNKVFVLSQDGHKLLHNVPSCKENEISKQKNLMIANKKQKEFSSEEKIVAKKNTCRTMNSSTVGITNASEDGTLDTKYWQLAASKFPVVRCEKLAVRKTEDNVNGVVFPSVKIHDKASLIPSVKDNSAKCNDISHKSLHISRLNDCKGDNRTTSKETKDPVEKKLDDAVDSNHNEDVIVLYNKRQIEEREKTFPLARPSIRVVHHKNLCMPNNVNNKLVSSNSDLACTDKSTENNELKVERNSDASVRTQKTVDSVKNKRLSECLDVIKEALISVKDEDLRAKALQALADCGIGIAKQVPITPRDQLKTVHDSQIQTEVFGLLDSQSFVLVKEKLPTIERIAQTVRSTINPLTVNAETQTKTKEIQVYKKTVSNNPIDNVDLFPMWKSVPVQDAQDLENYFKEYFKDNKDVNRVKKALSTPHSLFKKVATQLERDYEELHQYDENGMLNIHRAIVNNQLRAVQRLLLVLQASKVNIDVTNADGMTPLELAIKFDASEDIVKLLLEAGAKPLASELLHESAVILASKVSSPLLPHLLSHVTENELLNRVDTSGFAPLHYCALNGNLSGVIALIEAGADVNVRDNRSGRSPFFHALENDQVLVAHKLLQNGAIADLPNFAGQSVLSLVDEAKNLSLKAALRQIVI